MDENYFYKNLKISFSSEQIRFHVPSICLERLRRPMPMHSHGVGSYEVHYIAEGFGTLNIPSQSFPIVPGTLFVTGPELEHEQISLSEDPMLEYCVYLTVDRPDYALSRKNSHYSQFLSQNFWIGKGNETVLDLNQQMIHELTLQPFGYEPVLESLLLRYLIELCRLGRVEEGKEMTASALGISDPTLLSVEEAFLYHYDTLTLEELASSLGLSPRQTERFLLKNYNKSFQEKKTQARMSAALVMLRSTKAPVSSVAYSLGYSSAEHFTNAVKKYYQKTPTQIRRETS